MIALYRPWRRRLARLTHARIPCRNLLWEGGGTLWRRTAGLGRTRLVSLGVAESRGEALLAAKRRGVGEYEYWPHCDMPDPEPGPDGQDRPPWAFAVVERVESPSRGQ